MRDTSVKELKLDGVSYYPSYGLNWFPIRFLWEDWTADHADPESRIPHNLTISAVDTAYFSYIAIQPVILDQEAGVNVTPSTPFIKQVEAAGAISIVFWGDLPIESLAIAWDGVEIKPNAPASVPDQVDCTVAAFVIQGSPSLVVETLTPAGTHDLRVSGNGSFSYAITTPWDFDGDDLPDKRELALLPVYDFLQVTVPDIYAETRLLGDPSGFDLIEFSNSGPHIIPSFYWEIGVLGASLILEGEDPIELSADEDGVLIDGEYLFNTSTNEILLGTPLGASQVLEVSYHRSVWRDAQFLVTIPEDFFASHPLFIDVYEGQVANISINGNLVSAGEPLGGTYGFSDRLVTVIDENGTSSDLPENEFCAIGTQFLTYLVPGRHLITCKVQTAIDKNPDMQLRLGETPIPVIDEDVAGWADTFSDADSDGLVNAVDPSVFSAFTYHNGTLSQLVLPGTPGTDTDIEITCKPPAVDHSTGPIPLEWRAEEANSQKLHILPALVLYGRGTELSLASQANHLNLAAEPLHPLVRTDIHGSSYDPAGTGDYLPTGDFLATKTFVFPNMAQEAWSFTFQINHDHPVLDDGVIDLRFEMVWVVLAEAWEQESWQAEPERRVARWYPMDTNVTICGVQKIEYQNVAWLLADPDSRVERDALEAIAQNPAIIDDTGLSSTGLVDDIVGYQQEFPGWVQNGHLYGSITKEFPCSASFNFSETLDLWIPSGGNASTYDVIPQYGGHREVLALTGQVDTPVSFTKSISQAGSDTLEFWCHIPSANEKIKFEFLTSDIQLLGSGVSLEIGEGMLWTNTNTGTTNLGVFSSDAWHHFRVTYDGYAKAARVYVDGEFRGQVAYKGSYEEFLFSYLVSIDTWTITLASQDASTLPRCYVAGIGQLSDQSYELGDNQVPVVASWEDMSMVERLALTRATYPREQTETEVIYYNIQEAKVDLLHKILLKIQIDQDSRDQFFTHPDSLGLHNCPVGAIDDRGAGLGWLGNSTNDSSGVGCAAFIADNTGLHRTPLVLEDANPAGMVDVTFNLTALGRISGGRSNGTLSFWLYGTDEDAPLFIDLLGDDGTVGIALKTEASLFWMQNTQGNWISIDEFWKNEFFFLEVPFDCATGLFDLNLKGVALANCYNLTFHQNCATLSQICFRTGEVDSDYSYSIDAINWVSEEDSIDPPLNYIEAEMLRYGESIALVSWTTLSNVWGDEFADTAPELTPPLTHPWTTTFTGGTHDEFTTQLTQYPISLTLHRSTDSWSDDLTQEDILEIVYAEGSLPWIQFSSNDFARTSRMVLTYIEFEEPAPLSPPSLMSHPADILKVRTWEPPDFWEKYIFPHSQAGTGSIADCIKRMIARNQQKAADMEIIIKWLEKNKKDWHRNFKPANVDEAYRRTGNGQWERVDVNEYQIKSYTIEDLKGFRDYMVTADSNLIEILQNKKTITILWPITLTAEEAKDGSINYKTQLVRHPEKYVDKNGLIKWGEWDADYKHCVLLTQVDVEVDAWIKAQVLYGAGIPKVTGKDKAGQLIYRPSGTSAKPEQEWFIPQPGKKDDIRRVLGDQEPRPIKGDGRKVALSVDTPTWPPYWHGFVDENGIWHSNMEKMGAGTGWVADQFVKYLEEDFQKTQTSALDPETTQFHKAMKRFREAIDEDFLDHKQIQRLEMKGKKWNKRNTIWWNKIRNVREEVVTFDPKDYNSPDVAPDRRYMAPFTDKFALIKGQMDYEYAVLQGKIKGATGNWDKFNTLQGELHRAGMQSIDVEQLLTDKYPEFYRVFPTRGKTFYYAEMLKWNKGKFLDVFIVNFIRNHPRQFDTNDIIKSIGSITCGVVPEKIIVDHLNQLFENEVLFRFGTAGGQLPYRWELNPEKIYELPVHSGRQAFAVRIGYLLKLMRDQLIPEDLISAYLQDLGRPASLWEINKATGFGTQKIQKALKNLREQNEVVVIDDIARSFRYQSNLGGAGGGLLGYLTGLAQGIDPDEIQWEDSPCITDEFGTTLPKTPIQEPEDIRLQVWASADEFAEASKYSDLGDFLEMADDLDGARLRAQVADLTTNLGDLYSKHPELFLKATGKNPVQPVSISRMLDDQGRAMRLANLAEYPDGAMGILLRYDPDTTKWALDVFQKNDLGDLKKIGSTTDLVKYAGDLKFDKGVFLDIFSLVWTMVEIYQTENYGLALEAVFDIADITLAFTGGGSVGGLLFLWNMAFLGVQLATGVDYNPLHLAEDYINAIIHRTLLGEPNYGRDPPPPDLLYEAQYDFHPGELQIQPSENLDRWGGLVPGEDYLSLPIYAANLASKIELDSGYIKQDPPEVYYRTGVSTSGTPELSGMSWISDGLDPGYIKLGQVISEPEEGTVTKIFLIDHATSNLTITLGTQLGLYYESLDQRVDTTKMYSTIPVGMPVYEATFPELLAHTRPIDERSKTADIEQMVEDLGRALDEFQWHTAGDLAGDILEAIAVQRPIDRETFEMLLPLRQDNGTLYDRVALDPSLCSCLMEEFYHQGWRSLHPLDPDTIRTQYPDWPQERVDWYCHACTEAATASGGVALVPKPWWDRVQRVFDHETWAEDILSAIPVDSDLSVAWTGLEGGLDIGVEIPVTFNLNFSPDDLSIGNFPGSITFQDCALWQFPGEDTWTDMSEGSGLGRVVPAQGNHRNVLQLAVDPFVGAGRGAATLSLDDVVAGSVGFWVAGDLAGPNHFQIGQKGFELSGLGVEAHAKAIDIDGDVVYVAQGSYGLSCYDKNSLELLGYLYLGAPANDVEVRDGRAFVACGSAGLLVLDVSDPTLMVITGTCDTPQEVLAVALWGDHAIVTDGDALLRITISDPMNPCIVAEVATQATHVVVSEEYAFVLSGAYVRVISLESMTVETSYSLGSVAYDLWLDAQNHLYVVGNDLWVLQVGAGGELSMKLHDTNIEGRSIAAVEVHQGETNSLGFTPSGYFLHVGDFDDITTYYIDADFIGELTFLDQTGANFALDLAPLEAKLMFSSGAPGFYTPISMPPEWQLPTALLVADDTGGLHRVGVDTPRFDRAALQWEMSLVPERTNPRAWGSEAFLWQASDPLGSCTPLIDSWNFIRVDFNTGDQNSYMPFRDDPLAPLSYDVFLNGEFAFCGDMIAIPVSSIGFWTQAVLAGQGEFSAIYIDALTFSWENPGLFEMYDPTVYGIEVCISAPDFFRVNDAFQTSIYTYIGVETTNFTLAADPNFDFVPAGIYALVVECLLDLDGDGAGDVSIFNQTKAFSYNYHDDGVTIQFYPTPTDPVRRYLDSFPVATLENTGNVPELLAVTVDGIDPAWVDPEDALDGIFTASQNFRDVTTYGVPDLGSGTIGSWAFDTPDGTDAYVIPGKQDHRKVLQLRDDAEGAAATAILGLNTLYDWDWSPETGAIIGEFGVGTTQFDIPGEFLTVDPAGQLAAQLPLPYVMSSGVLELDFRMGEVAIPPALVEDAQWAVSHGEARSWHVGQLVLTLVPTTAETVGIEIVLHGVFAYPGSGPSFELNWYVESISGTPWHEIAPTQPAPKITGTGAVHVKITIDEGQYAVVFETGEEITLMNLAGLDAPAGSYEALFLEFQPREPVMLYSDARADWHLYEIEVPGIPCFYDFQLRGATAVGLEEGALEFWFQTSDPEGETSFEFWDEDRTPVIQLALQGGTYWANGVPLGGKDLSPVPIDPDTWYHVHLSFDRAGGNVTVWINGEIVPRLNAFPLGENMPPIHYFAVTTGQADANYRVYLDAIGYDADPGYRAGWYNDWTNFAYGANFVLEHEGFWALSSASGNFNATDSFTNCSLGGVPSGWLDGSSGESAITTIPGQAAGVDFHKSVLTFADRDAGQAKAVLPFLDAPDQSAVEFWVFIADGNQPFTMALGTTAIQLEVHDGAFWHVDALGTHNLTALTNYTWLHVRVVYDCTAGTFNLFLNGQGYGAGLAFLQPVVTIDQLAFWTDPGALNYTFSIDAVGLEWRGYGAFNNTVPLADAGTFLLDPGLTKNLHIAPTRDAIPGIYHYTITFSDPVTGAILGTTNGSIEVVGTYMALFEYSGPNAWTAPGTPLSCPTPVGGYIGSKEFAGSEAIQIAGTDADTFNISLDLTHLASFDGTYDLFLLDNNNQTVDGYFLIDGVQLTPVTGWIPGYEGLMEPVTFYPVTLSAGSTVQVNVILDVQDGYQQNSFYWDETGTWHDLFLIVAWPEQPPGWTIDYWDCARLVNMGIKDDDIDHPLVHWADARFNGTHVTFEFDAQDQSGVDAFVFDPQGATPQVFPLDASLTHHEVTLDLSNPLLSIALPLLPPGVGSFQVAVRDADHDVSWDWTMTIGAVPVNITMGALLARMAVSVDQMLQLVPTEFPEAFHEDLREFARALGNSSSCAAAHHPATEVLGWLQIAHGYYWDAISTYLETAGNPGLSTSPADPLAVFGVHLAVIGCHAAGLPYYANLTGIPGYFCEALMTAELIVPFALDRHHPEAVQLLVPGVRAISEALFGVLAAYAGTPDWTDPGITAALAAATGELGNTAKVLASYETSFETLAWSSFGTEITYGAAQAGRVDLAFLGLQDFPSGGNWYSLQADLDHELVLPLGLPCPRWFHPWTSFTDGNLGESWVLPTSEEIQFEVALGDPTGNFSFGISPHRSTGTYQFLVEYAGGDLFVGYYNQSRGTYERIHLDAGIQIFPDEFFPVALTYNLSSGQFALHFADHDYAGPLGKEGNFNAGIITPYNPYGSDYDPHEWGWAIPVQASYGAWVTPINASQNVRWLPPLLSRLGNLTTSCLHGAISSNISRLVLNWSTSLHELLINAEGMTALSCFAALADPLWTCLTHLDNAGATLANNDHWGTHAEIEAAAECLNRLLLQGEVLTQDHLVDPTGWITFTGTCAWIKAEIDAFLGVNPAGCPLVTNPPDLTYFLGTTGHIIKWTVVGNPVNPSWTVFRDGENFASGAWASDESIFLSVDGLSIGTHVFHLVVDDGVGGSTTDTVLVLVQAPGPVTVAGPGSMLLWCGEDAFLIWEVTGNLVSTYNFTILLNGGVFTRGNATNSRWITVAVNTTRPGTFLYRLQYADATGRSVTDEVLVVVRNVAPVFASAPEDATIACGAATLLSWTMIDDTTRNASFEIWQGTTLVQAGMWASEVPITGLINTTLPPGTYTFTVEINDGFGALLNQSVKITLVPDPPVLVSGPGAIYTVAGFSPVSLEWVFCDASVIRPTYVIFAGNTQLGNGTWGSGQPIQLDWTPPAGQWVVSIHISDGCHGHTTHSVPVTAVTNDQPEVVLHFTTPVVIPWEQLPGVTLNWTGSDAWTHPTNATFAVDCDGFIVETGTWIPHTNATLPVSGLQPGDHNFTIHVADGYGLQADRAFKVYILPPADEDTTAPKFHEITLPALITDGDGTFVIQVNVTDASGVANVTTTLAGVTYNAIWDGTWWNLEVAVPPVLGNLSLVIVAWDADNDAPGDSLNASTTVDAWIQDDDLSGPQLGMNVLSMVLTEGGAVVVTFGIEALDPESGVDLNSLHVQIGDQEIPGVGPYSIVVFPFETVLVSATVKNADADRGGVDQEESTGMWNFTLGPALYHAVLEQALADLWGNLQGLPTGAWNHPQKRAAMDRKLAEVAAFLSATDYEGAYAKILRDVKPKLSGVKVDEKGVPWGTGIFPHPWIADAGLRSEFGLACDALLWACQVLHAEEYRVTLELLGDARGALEALLEDIQAVNATIVRWVLTWQVSRALVNVARATTFVARDQNDRAELQVWLAQCRVDLSAGVISLGDHLGILDPDTSARLLADCAVVGAILDQIFLIL